jgi:hypothetical protein
MNPENIEVKQESRLHRVTPLSRYLALALFIALPFIGGWVGYVNAPDEIVEVQVVTPKDSNLSEKAPNNFVSIGQRIGDMEVTEIGPLDDEYSTQASISNFKLMLKGSQEIKGKYGYITTETGFEGYCIYELSEETRSTISSLPVYPLQTIGENEGGPGQYRKMLCIRNTDLAEKILGKEAKNVALIIDNYELNSSLTDFSDWVDLVKVKWFYPIMDVPKVNPGETAEVSEYKASFLGGFIPADWHEISMLDNEYSEGKSRRYSFSPNAIYFGDISWDQVDFYLLAEGAAETLINEVAAEADVIISSSTIGTAPVIRIQYPLDGDATTKAGTGGTSYIIEMPKNQIQNESDPRHVLIVKQALAEEDFEKGFQHYLETVDLSNLFNK